MFPILFHHFHAVGERPVGSGSTTIDRLKEIIEDIGRHNIVNARKWKDNLINDELFFENVCFTFDDSIRSQVDVALPILDEYDIKAFWFIPSSPYTGGVIHFEIVRYFFNFYFENFNQFFYVFMRYLNLGPLENNDWRQINEFVPKNYLREYPFYSENERIYRFIRDDILGAEKHNKMIETMISDYGISVNELKEMLWIKEDDIVRLSNEGHVIGLHSFSHPLNFSKLGYQEQKLEYERNFLHLTELLGDSPDTMAHPSGSYNQHTLAILRELGVKIGFTDNCDRRDLSNLELPRIDCNSF